jgi:hypothetical protein
MANVRLTMDLSPEIKVIVLREGEALERPAKSATEQAPVAEAPVEEATIEEAPASESEEIVPEAASEAEEN